ncbi:hypothetical protein LBMAG53_01930 [Planctomycetota bacterium]|nr:hypothetical protein LBMAG53_01930 [Planctomycetota bacterium]
MRYLYPVLFLMFGGVALLFAADGAAPAEAPFTWKEFIHMIEAGGVTMYPLGLLSVAALAYSLERFLRLDKKVLAPPDLSERCRKLWAAGDRKGVIAAARESKSALGKSIETMVVFYNKPLDYVVALASNIATAELLPHVRACKPLIVIATTAPLLGLFGTILGMIGAFRKFQAIGSAGGDPSTFAGNISEALVTAATGLIIAAYSLFLYHLFKNKALRIGDELRAEINTLAIEWLLPNTEDVDRTVPAPSVASGAAKP